MPTNRPRPDPHIPDHEVLRRIGGGAYGEVWLARGVTGALRAVKVVWREDFDDERSFEREFEGILKFEPISRDHPGLVNILHVGRSPDGVSFYYYVMELGDDVVTGREINPVEYEARTLRTDVKRTPGKRLDTELCIDVGVRLAEALRHLHDSGLAHRDVKPANVIFVGGKAKLADIGLVAARGQRTFVGTEGFVPPEGPGSAQADIYSLGKVLYEIASGKDRMDFPELPDDMPPKSERKRWLVLNHIICDICEPQLSKRRISSAGELAEALRRLQEGKRRRRRRPAFAFFATLCTAAVLVIGAWEAFKGSSWMAGIPEKIEEISSFIPPSVLPTKEKQRIPALIKINSRPEGALVLDMKSGGESVMTTPTDMIESYVGEQVHFRLERAGYSPQLVEAVVPPSAAEEPLLLEAELKIYAPPQPNLPWEDYLGQRYGPVGDGHESRRSVGRAEWERYRAATGRPADAAEFVEVEENGTKRAVAVTSVGEAEAFCWWLAKECAENGYLTERHQALPLMDIGPMPEGLSERARQENLRSFRCRVQPIPFGRVMLTTEPVGADVVLRTLSDGAERLVGAANGAIELESVRPGEGELVLQMGGYKKLVHKFNLQPGETLPLHLKLQLDNSVVMTQPWENGLGMKFVPLGPDLMASIWEARVSDYDAFVRATGHAAPSTEFSQGPDHPVVFVSRDDAVAFCRWLTGVERGQERIKSLHEYRLPTDLEWSLMAGQIERADLSPARRDSLREKIFMWGAAWPLGADAKVGNLADVTAARAPGFPAALTIEGYDDGYEKTAPVGQFPPNSLGIYDLCGNVHEWVADNYSATSTSGVLRGGGWNTYQPVNLYIGSRNTQPPGFRDAIYGFRVVLAKVRGQRETSPAGTSPGTDTDG